MIFPARNLHLFTGFSMAMLNNQMVTGIWGEYATNIIWLVVSTNPSEK